MSMSERERLAYSGVSMPKRSMGETSSSWVGGMRRTPTVNERVALAGGVVEAEEDVWEAMIWN